MEIPIQAVIYEAEEGGYWTSVPSLPGCAARGEALDELMANLREAIEGWMGAGAEVRPDPDDEEPWKVVTLGGSSPGGNSVRPWSGAAGGPGTSGAAITSTNTRIGQAGSPSRSTGTRP